MNMCIKMYNITAMAILLPFSSAAQDYNCVDLLKMMLSNANNPPAECNVDNDMISCRISYSKVNYDMSRDIFIPTSQIDSVDIGYGGDNIFIQCGLMPCINYMVNLPPDVERLNEQIGSLQTSGIESSVIIYLPYYPSASLVSAVEKCK